jgi:hypothetical protein
MMELVSRMLAAEFPYNLEQASAMARHPAYKGRARWTRWTMCGYGELENDDWEALRKSARRDLDGLNVLHLEVEVDAQEGTVGWKALVLDRST